MRMKELYLTRDDTLCCRDAAVYFLISRLWAFNFLSLNEIVFFVEMVEFADNLLISS